jgi:hypothetical protein
MNYIQDTLKKVAEGMGEEQEHEPHKDDKSWCADCGHNTLHRKVTERLTLLGLEKEYESTRIRNRAYERAHRL